MEDDKIKYDEAPVLDMYATAAISGIVSRINLAARERPATTELGKLAMEIAVAMIMERRSRLQVRNPGVH